MKLGEKRGIKRVVAFITALVLAFMPMNGAVPVLANDNTVTLTIYCKNTVAIDSLILFNADHTTRYEIGYNYVVSDTSIDNGSCIQVKGLSLEAGTYYLTGNVNDSYENSDYFAVSKKIVVDNQTNLTIGDSSNLLEPTLRLPLQYVLQGDNAMSVSVTIGGDKKCEVNNGTDSSTYTVTIPEDTPYSAVIYVDITMQKALYAPSSISDKEPVKVGNVDTTYYRYTYSLSELLKGKTISQDASSDLLHVSEPYKFDTILESPTGKIEFSSDKTAVTGSNEKAYYSADTKVTATWTLANSLDKDYKVYVGTSTRVDTQPLDWTEVSSTDFRTYSKIYTSTDAANGAFYVWYKVSVTNNSVNTIESTPVCSTSAIEFDTTPPAGNVMRDISPNVSNNDESSVPPYWAKDKFTITLSGITDSQSGLDYLYYVFTNDTSRSIDISQTDVKRVEVQSDGIFEIPYGLSDKSDYLLIKVFDKAGNSTTTKAINISDLKFDKTAPTAKIAYYDAAGNELSADALEKWQTGAVTVAVIGPEDVNLQDAASNEGVSGLSGNAVKVESGDKTLSLTPGTYDSSETVYTATVDADGQNSVKVTVQDVATNTMTESAVIKIDSKGITGSQMTLNGSSTASDFSGSFTVEASATSISGINKVDFVFHDDLTGKDTMYTVAASENRAVCPFPTDVYSDEFSGTVKAVFYDNTGAIVDNHMVTTSAKSLNYNKNGADIRMSASNRWTTENVPVTVTVSDRTTGIQKIEFLVNGVVVKTVTNLEQIHSYAGGIEISENSLSDEGTRVTVNVTSTTGVVTTDYLYVYVDKQAPVVTLSGITEGAVYSSNRTLNLTVAENIWQKMQPVTITATRTIDGTTTNLDLGAVVPNSASITDSRSFTEDGVYTVTVTAVDAAGNRDSKTISFTIDKTAPLLSISGVREGAYSSSPVTLNFQSIESFYETNRVTINVERKLEGVTYGSTVNFVNSGKTSNVSNTFQADGDYTVTMTAVDAAGNVAATQTLTFTVDATAPLVTIAGTEDYMITTKPVSLNFSVTESYYDTNQVKISGNRRLSNGKVESLDISGWVNSGKTSTMAREFTEDGYYTIMISATDHAGNKRQQEIHFTIDTQAPIIAETLKERYQGGHFKSFKLDETLDELIDELTAPTVRMTLNGKAYDGSEIVEDGKYTLVIEVMDEVGFTSSQTIEFAIDNTAPKIIFAGATDGKTYTEAVRLNLSLENENDSIEQILINGEEQLLTEGKTSYDYTFNTFDTYTVSVDTVDEAGNTNSQSITFTYAEHKQTGYLWVILAAAAAAIVLVAVLVIGGRRKK